MNIHDSGYKRLFSNKTIFRQLMETFVTEPWVKDLDFEQMEMVNKSFTSEHYKETESDLIYRVHLHGRDVYFLTEAHYDLDLVVVELLGLLEREEDRQAISLFLNWFRQLREHDRMASDDFLLTGRFHLPRQARLDQSNLCPQPDLHSNPRGAFQIFVHLATRGQRPGHFPHQARPDSSIHPVETCSAGDVDRHPLAPQKI